MIIRQKDILEHMLKYHFILKRNLEEKTKIKTYFNLKSLEKTKQRFFEKLSSINKKEYVHWIKKQKEKRKEKNP